MRVKAGKLVVEKISELQNFRRFNEKGVLHFLKSQFYCICITRSSLETIESNRAMAADRWAARGLRPVQPPEGLLSEGECDRHTQITSY